MFKGERNKMIGNKDFKSNQKLRQKDKPAETVEKTFYSPEKHTSVQAKNLAEATEKLKKIKTN